MKILAASKSCAIALCLAYLSMSTPALHAEAPLTPALVLRDDATRDQDDLCIWLHPERPAESTVVVSDKAASKIFVYDLTGKAIDAIAVDGKPGNIDLRYGFPLGAQRVDIAAYNDRDNKQIRVYQIDPESRKLLRVDDGAIATELNYGMTLYRSPKTGKFYAFTVPDSDGDRAGQYELYSNGSGKIAGRLVRSWKQGKSEGCVADDDHARLFIAEETRGIWRFEAEPDASTEGELILPIGEHGFTADAEGLTIFHRSDGTGFLIASSQGNSQFKIFRRETPHAYVDTFTVEGAKETDGIDLLNANLGPEFPQGVFALHNGAITPCPTLVCRLDGIAALTGAGLWNPRDLPGE
ncbi:MAG: phytase [Candidatus Hydrogenedentes bacterium]|nr:phytase [Candidatus Hydrogenedentota bacterium]